MAIGEETGETCNRNGCQGVMQEVDDETSCSCHIHPPCSHCVDMIYECSECDEETDPPSFEPTSNPIAHEIPEQYRRRKTDYELFQELPADEFGYVTIPGQYYWMEYKGKYPESMSVEKILENFNVCFGYKWIDSPSNGWFHIKVYTD